MKRFNKQLSLAGLALAISAPLAWAQGGHLGAAQVAGSTQVTYISAPDMHLHLMTPGIGTLSNQAVQDQDISGGGPVASGTSIFTIFDLPTPPVSPVPESLTHFISADLHVQNRNTNPDPDKSDPPSILVGSLDDTASIGGVPKALAGTAVTMVADNINKDPQTYYIAQDGNLHMLGTPQTGPAVRDLDLQALAGGPTPTPGTALAGAGDIEDSVVAVFYLDAKQHVQKVAYDASFNFWSEDPTALAGAPLAASGSPLTSLQLDTITVTAYLGADQHLYALFYSPFTSTWSFSDLTKDASAVTVAKTSSLTSLRDGNTHAPEIFYIGSDQHVHMVVANGRGGWSDFDITTVSKSNPINGSSLASVFDPEGASNFTRVFYVGTDQHVHRIVSSRAGVWTDSDLTASTGAVNAIP